MTEDEEREKLQAEVNELTKVTQGGFTEGRIARLTLSSLLMLEKSNRSLAASSERLSKRNLWLTWALLGVGLLQLIIVAFQVWLMMHTPPVQQAQSRPTVAPAVVIPNSAASDGEVSWCAAHPSTSWSFGPLSPEESKSVAESMRSQGEDPAFTDAKPISGSCDSSGQVIVNRTK